MLMKVKYKLDSIKIEGFKGFTHPQTISISGKHLFIFAANGHGKSSIIEAIRWCLFGLMGRPEEIIRNQFYMKGDCNVELKLMANDGLWQIKRKLSPGSNQSRQTITDPQGIERPQNEVFPFLTSIGPKEGPYVILGGPSQVPSRKHPLEGTEISDYSKVIYTYLHLEEVPELIEKLTYQIDFQKEEINKLRNEIDLEKTKFEHQIENIDAQITSLLQNPPWDDTTPPTWSETRDKIKNLIEKIETLTGKRPKEEVTEDRILSLALKWVRDFVVPKEDELNDLIDEKEELLDRIHAFQRELDNKNSEIDGISSRINELSEKLKNTLGTRSLGQIQKQLENLESKIEQTNLLLDIAKKFELYLSEFTIQNCILCSAEVNHEELEKSNREMLEQEPKLNKILQERNNLEELIEEINLLTRQIERERANLNQTQAKYVEIKQKLSDLTNLKGRRFTSKNIQSFINKIEAQIASLRQTLKSKQEIRQIWEDNINRLIRELKFHRSREKKERIQNLLEEELNLVEINLKDIIEFLESLKEIRRNLSVQLKEVLHTALPPISVKMTEVYQHLTKQVSFDQIKIELDEEKSKYYPKLSICVQSSSKPDLPPIDPAQVLNGQALNALRFVPYFVFSQFQEETWGLDLLLLDDPTQSFDVQRIELLFNELQTVANHAQLVVGSHEIDRFRPNISKFFDDDQVAILNIKGFNIENGPDIELH